MAEYQRRMKISICTSEWPPRCWSIFATTGKVRSGGTTASGVGKRTTKSVVKRICAGNR